MVQERVTLWQEREELQGNNERLFGKLERRKAVKVQTVDKRCNLETWPVMADADVPEEVFVGLVALDRELWEKAARLAICRHWKSSDIL